MVVKPWGIEGTRVYYLNGGGATYKSIGVDEIVTDALANEVNTIITISAGNFVGAVAGELKRRNLAERILLVNLVNRPLQNPSSLEMVIESNLVLRDAAEREAYAAERIPHAGKVRDYTDFIPQALVSEADKVLSTGAGYIGLSLGGGKFWVTLDRRIKSKDLKVKLIGVVPEYNGIFKDDNLYTDSNGLLRYKKFEPDEIFDKISTPYTYYKDEIVGSLERGNVIIQASKEQILRAWYTAYMSHPDVSYAMPEPSAAAAFVVDSPEIRRKYGVSPDKLLIVNTGNGLGEDSYLQRHNSNVDQVKPQLYIEFLKRLPEFERRASSTDQCLMYEWAVVFVSGSVPQRTTLNDKSFLETIAGQGRAARAGIGLVKM